MTTVITPAALTRAEDVHHSREMRRSEQESYLLGEVP